MECRREKGKREVVIWEKVERRKTTKRERARERRRGNVFGRIVRSLRRRRRNWRNWKYRVLSILRKRCFFFFLEAMWYVVEDFEGTVKMT